MAPLRFLILSLLVNSGFCQPLSARTTNVTETATLVDNFPLENNYWEPSEVDVHPKYDFSGTRHTRHIGGGGVIGGFGVIGGGGGGFSAPVYAAPPVPVVSYVPVVTTVPVATSIPSYPVYGGYGGYGGGFGGLGAGFGIAKFKVKGFGIGGGFLG